MTDPVERIADFVIVGAGAAGCVVAERLSAGGKYLVVVVEAGPRDLNPFIHIPAGFLHLVKNPRVSWGLESVPMRSLNGRVIGLAQGKMIGGTASLNGMLYLRSNRQDHANWLAQGCTGWSFEECQPFYNTIERHSEGPHRDENSLSNLLPVNPFREVHPLSRAFVQACGEYGLPVLDGFNSGERFGAGFFHQTREGRFRKGSGQTFGRVAARRSNVEFITEAFCERVIFEGPRAVGVRFSKGGQSQSIRATKEVILSAGAIRSPQLLQVSGVGPAAHLKSLGVPVIVDSPNVGANLRDHFCTRIAHRVSGIITLNERATGLPLLRELFRYVFFGGGLLTLGATNSGAYTKTDPALTSPNLQLSFAPATYRPGTLVLESESGMTVMTYPSYALSQGTVLARSADIREHPAVDPNHISHIADQQAVVTSMKQARAILAQPAIAKFSDRELLPGPAVQTDDELLGYARETGVSGSHYMGTCQMGDAPDTVVDPRLRVRGVEGLRVIDASIYPMATCGNIQAPTIMAGAKGAAMVLEDVI